MKMEKKKKKQEMMKMRPQQVIEPTIQVCISSHFISFLLFADIKMVKIGKLPLLPPEPFVTPAPFVTPLNQQLEGIEPRFVALAAKVIIHLAIFVNTN